MNLHLLTADWHLDDLPENEYRWGMFKVVRDLVSEFTINQVFVLGDMVDRRDYHSAAFINRLLGEVDDEAMWTVLRGNHDTTIRPPNYLEFMPNYVARPRNMGNGLLLLPFSPNPTEEWRDFDFSEVKAVYMHATVTGAQVNNGIVLENPNFPALPQHLKIYSGDIHHPQRVGNVTYVGAPHPTKFGDDYKCRMLLIDSKTYNVIEEIPLDSVRKLMVDIHQIDDLAKVKVRPGDQIKLRVHCAPGDDPSALDMAMVANWAKQKDVTIAGTEVDIDTVMVSGVDISQTPEAILREFGMHEKLSDDMLAVGLDLLGEVS